MPVTQICKSELHIKTPAWFHLERNAYAPTYNNFSMPTEQLTGDMASFEHITEALKNFYYYSLPEQPYAWLSPGQTTNHFPYNCM